MRRILSLLSKRTTSVGSSTTIGRVDHRSTLSSLSTISMRGGVPSTTSTSMTPTKYSSTQIISNIGTFQPQRSFGTDATDKKSSLLEEYLNSLSPARKKFLEILSEYKANNFAQATPTRFVKMLVKAVDSNQDGVITMEGTFYLLFRCSHHDVML